MVRVWAFLLIASFSISSVSFGSAYECHSLFTPDFVTRRLENAEADKRQWWKDQFDKLEKELAGLDKGKADEIRASIKEFAKPGEDVVLSPKRKIPTVINGLKRNWKAVPAQLKPIKINQKYDVIALGGGMAGTTGALTTVQEGMTVMLIEQRDQLGGLAYGNSRGGNHFDGGTAYYSPLIPEQEPIYRLLGLHRWEKDAFIHHPSDSVRIPKGYLQKDGTKKEIFEDFWENENILDNEMPVGWKLTRWAHHELNKQNKIPNQPIEDAETPFDNMNYEQFLKSQYYMLRDHVAKNPKDEYATKLWERIQADLASGREKIETLVDDVLKYYIVNYMHSAKGGMPDKVNAAAALNFVFSEMITRYSYPFGTNEIIRRSELLLRFKPRQAKISLGSTIETVEEIADGVRVTFTRDGQRYQVEGKKAIFSMPLNLAPKMIKGFNHLAPVHNRIIQQYIANGQSTDYLVGNWLVNHHPKKLVRRTYDMWLGQDIESYHDFNIGLPTDLISGEWQFYHGYTKPIPQTDKVSVASDYHPLGPNRERTQDEILNTFENDLTYIKEIYDPLIVADGEKPFEVLFAELNYWPHSILVPHVGHFRNAKLLRQPIGRNILPAVAGWMDTPSHEAAQYRGWRAVKEIANELKGRGRHAGQR